MNEQGTCSLCLAAFPPVGSEYICYVTSRDGRYNGHALGLCANHFGDIEKDAYNYRFKVKYTWVGNSYKKYQKL